MTCPNDPSSCATPDGYYPVLGKALGAPKGPRVREGDAGAARFRWRREFAHASVFFDLQDRNATSITWHDDTAPVANSSWRPPLGWSSWNTFGLQVNETIIKSSAVTMASDAAGLKAAGYEYVLIDDGWTQCLAFDGPRCATPAPRGADGLIPVNATKFPSGFKALAAFVHGQGLKLGIYTSVGARTCGGFVGSLGHEATDARWFAAQGFDFVKHDTCDKCGIHDGCIQNAVRRMGVALHSANPDILYYLDSGNPVSPDKTFNPFNRAVRTPVLLDKLATSPEELVWVWTASIVDPASGEYAGPRMFKSWFDRENSWASLLSNVHNQHRTTFWQSCGRFNNPDFVTSGQVGGAAGSGAGLTEGQSRVEVFLYAVLGAPLILAADIRKFAAGELPFVQALVTHDEVLAIDQDPDCVQGSLANFRDLFSETWVKPLHDGSFAVVLLNKDPDAAHNVTTAWAPDSNDGEVDKYLNDYYPATFGGGVRIRNVYERHDYAETFECCNFTVQVPPMDAVLLKVTPL